MKNTETLFPTLEPNILMVRLALKENLYPLKVLWNFNRINMKKLNQ